MLKGNLTKNKTFLWCLCNIKSKKNHDANKRDEKKQLVQTYIKL